MPSNQLTVREDITAKNILQHISSLDGLSEAEVLGVFGQPDLNHIDKVDLSTEESPSVLDYLVYPVDWTEVDKVGMGSDLWAVACTLFEIRTGRPLFSAFDNDDDDYLVAIVRILGVLPEPWWSSTWGRRKEYYKDEGDELGRVIPHREEPPLPPNVSIHPSVAQNARSLRDKLAPGVWYMDSGLPDEVQHRDIPEQEIEVFADLLGKLLRYRPEDRISAEEALSHEWFTM
ncbi:uncharacterized protein DNG_03054 [Cephalotrichum gorgonifer]|uniref:Protein kinase domain-containing protein n=1 Tax=Cephalotrichum gorgonifer TaxID=2041049 RepID=A0AAE8MV32_9PEZI|nr:uncharacterized protein DNG_03054 [Cephalotrichum gorgonifer]